MGLVAEQQKAIWLKLDKSTGFLKYGTGQKDADGKSIYKPVPGGLANVYLSECVFKVETDRDGKRSKKLHATFVDADDGGRFVLTTGWSSRPSRSLIYEAAHPDFDPSRPLSFKTFLSKEPLSNGFKPIIPLLSQVPNPGKGDYLGNLGSDIKNGVLDSFKVTKAGEEGNYEDFDWNTILMAKIELLQSKLRKAEQARVLSHSGAPSSYVADDDYDDEDDSFDYASDPALPAPVPSSILFAAPSAPSAPSAAAPSPLTAQIKELVASLGWSDEAIAGFYALFGCDKSSNREQFLVSTKKAEEAITYLKNMLSIYESAAELSKKGLSGTKAERDYCEYFIGIANRKGYLQITDAAEAARILKEYTEIPF